MKWCCSLGLFIGRIMLSLIFLWGGISKFLHWEETVQLVVAHHLPQPALIAGVVCAVELLGGLALFLGFKARFGALLLILVTIATTVYLHNFWMMEGADAQVHKIFFINNLAIIGGLFYVMCCGAGGWAFDRSCGSCKTHQG